MSCASCSSSGTPKGCKNNGLCGISGCNKLNVVDWLGNIKPASRSTDFYGVEVRFKNGRKGYYINEEYLSIYIGDIVVVEEESGFDVGVVSLSGDLVKIQMKKKKELFIPGKSQKILRKATNTDIKTWEKGRSKETDALLFSRQKALDLKLDMKVSDVEFQGDGEKATFYYTSEGRVDFRELVKVLAGKFKVKIEMKQIGMRQEASRLGGIGSCGRELCCSTWLTDFRSVSTSAARYQQLSLNPEKLAGQCGKLKCCLNYELDNYMESLKEFPKSEIKLKTKKGIATFQKLDVFGKKITYTYEENPSDFITISVDRAKFIIDKNKQGQKVEELQEFDSRLNETNKGSFNKLGEYSDVVGQDSLTRFDKKRKKKGRSNRKKSFRREKK